MVANDPPTLVITCKLSLAQKLTVVETITSNARIVYLDELQEPAVRRAAPRQLLRKPLGE